jgi:hypothetical protein
MRAIEAVSTVLSRHTDFKSWPEVTLGGQQDLLMGVNRALSMVFRYGPSRRKRAWVSQAIGDSYAVDGLDLDPNETQSGNASAFRPDERYQTILITGDPQYNTIVDVDRVAYPYRGTETADTGTLYVDAFPFFDFSVVRITGVVKCKRPDGYEFDLLRDDMGTTNFQFAAPEFGPAPRYAANSTSTLRQRTTSQYPTSYQVCEVGNSRNTDADASFLIRVDPIPTTKCTLVVQIDQEPAMLTIESLSDGAILPMSDAQVAELFMPLLEEEIALSKSLWSNSPEVRQLVLRRGEEARMRLRELPQYYAPPQAMIGPNPGF